MTSALQVVKANQGQVKGMFPDEMLEAFAEIMTLNEVEDGHIFVKEGEGTYASTRCNYFDETRTDLQLF
jgi:hypothetical protein